ncbi:iron-containing alcohol dehydrogenase [Halobacillus litoralis]|uniref:iron-containing alcohol dehydrogenase n=1 Tax=Halobacillus litoralis TaxID=45668 RepID=UPI001CD437AA|nr:iron-containing alcohol dehydrogenase [Halobacillus litoralis]MCA1024291.1 iron-containing alcohol dehydrogenase [Halobacillus litoralis]
MEANINELLMPRTVLYGIGAFKEVGKQTENLGTKALIISDPIMESIGNVAACEEYLQEVGVPFTTYTGVDTEPTNIHVREAMERCTAEKCDVVIAIGGGSCIDTAKAVAVLMTNGGLISEYFETDKPFHEKPLPLIALPTTAGTGSEVTKVTVITDTKTNVKMMLARRELLPEVAIVDPKLTISCPKSVTAATGVDALCHAIEAFISKKAHPVTDALALSAIDHIMKNIRRAYHEDHDLEAKDKMSLGSMLAGVAFSNASVALVHGMSRPIGALFHVPHGISNAMLLPAVLEFTKKEASDRLAEIGRMIFPQSSDLTNQELADRFIEEIKNLCMDLTIPNIRDYGLDGEVFQASLSKMAEDAIASGSPSNTPRVPTHQEIIELYNTSYIYDFSAKMNTPHL